jgi:hypothetical protein
LAEPFHLIAELEERKITAETIESFSPSDRFVFHVFAGLAEFKLNLSATKPSHQSSSRPRMERGRRQYFAQKDQGKSEHCLSRPKSQ